MVTGLCLISPAFPAVRNCGSRAVHTLFKFSFSHCSHCKQTNTSDAHSPNQPLTPSLNLPCHYKIHCLFYFLPTLPLQFPYPQHYSIPTLSNTLLVNTLPQPLFNFLPMLPHTLIPTYTTYNSTAYSTPYLYYPLLYPYNYTTPTLPLLYSLSTAPCYIYPLPAPGPWYQSWNHLSHHFMRMGKTPCASHAWNELFIPSCCQALLWSAVLVWYY